MKTLKLFRNMLIWILVLTLSVPPTIGAQDGKAEPRKFSQEELDQMLAPIALYPDSLLAQVLMAATYPLEVVMADRWVKENKDLTGDALNNALDKQPWDPSVKALVPVPNVLTMMSTKLDWTQRVGDAFLSQEADVMNTVQNLRQKAYTAGNLKTTAEQTIVREKETIIIQPARPEVVYVPVYDPWWVYGPWWYPAYPPYVLYPYPGVVLAPGVVWFGTGFFVGIAWYWAWGHWDWRHRHVYVNVNRTININRTNINIRNVRTQVWRHDPVHRRGVVYRDLTTRERFRQIDRKAVESRRQFRGFEKGGVSRPASVPARTVRPEAAPARKLKPEAAPGRVVSPGAAVSRPEAGRQRPERTIERGRTGHVFEGVGRGSEVRKQSARGQESRSVGKSRGKPADSPSQKSPGGKGKPKGGREGGSRDGRR